MGKKHKVYLKYFTAAAIVKQSYGHKNKKITVVEACRDNGLRSVKSTA